MDVDGLNFRPRLLVVLDLLVAAGLVSLSSDLRFNDEDIDEVRSRFDRVLCCEDRDFAHSQHVQIFAVDDHLIW